MVKQRKKYNKKERQKRVEIDGKRQKHYTHTEVKTYETKIKTIHILFFRCVFMDMKFFAQNI